MTPKPRALLVPLMLLAVAVGGCADGATKSAETPPPPTTAVVTASTGGIEGTLVDDEQSPVGGATVGIRLVGGGRENSTTSSAAGAYAFSGLEPAEYELVVQSPFFKAVSKKATVIAGEVVRGDFVLQRVPEAGPQVVMVPLKGYIVCSVGWRNPTNPSTSGGNPVTSNPCYNMQGDKTVFYLDWNLNLTLSEVVLELVWQPGTGFSGSALRLDLCSRMPPENNYAAQCKLLSGNQPYARSAVGKSPVVMRRSDLPVATIKQYQATAGDGGYDLAAPDTLRVPVTYQQAFDLYVTACYFQNCTADYKGRPPA